ncbi:hypothetical protein Vi05172_g3283 [Venturia inaequalis]|nr:hypothetical protein Vi05172_g3283 [Venturia inaequalis]
MQIQARNQSRSGTSNKNLNTHSTINRNSTQHEGSILQPNKPSAATIAPWCPYGGDYYSCPASSSSKFVGCCFGGIMDCEAGCAPEDLRATSFESRLIGSFVDGACSLSSGSKFYQCATTRPDDYPFIGCCKINPCNIGCSPGNLGAAVAPVGVDAAAYGVDTGTTMATPSSASIQTATSTASIAWTTSTASTWTTAAATISTPISELRSTATSTAIFISTSLSTLVSSSLSHINTIKTPAPATSPTFTTLLTSHKLTGISLPVSTTAAMAMAAPPAKSNSVVVGGSIAGGLLLLLPLVGWWVWHFLKKRRARGGAEGGRESEEALVTETMGTGKMEVGEGAVVERERGRGREVYELSAEEVYHAK